MASKRIRIMISSRCNDKIKSSGGTITISELRVRAKKKIEEFQVFGHDSFDCWIHEDAPPLDAAADAWDQCEKLVRENDIILVLYNGNAGSATNGGGIGICHVELMTAIEAAAERVRMIDIQQANAGALAGKQRDKRFQDYVAGLKRPTRFAKNDEETLQLMLDAIQDAVVDMVHDSSLSGRKGRYDSGGPLDWSRLDFASRKAAMEAVLGGSLKDAGAQSAGSAYVRRVKGVPVLFCCHAVPAAMSVAAAREMVGRPFLHDHELIRDVDDEVAGPVHVIACQKGVTENQASALLGFPDLTIVTPRFGVYVADNIQKIQVVLLANCRDDASTRYAAQRFFDWLVESGEAAFLADRARGRRAIVAEIAAQISRGQAVAKGAGRGGSV